MRIAVGPVALAQLSITWLFSGFTLGESSCTGGCWFRRFRVGLTVQSFA